MYNNYGKEGLSESGFHASNPFDIFSSFFGGGSPFGRQQERGPKRGPDLRHPLHLTMADLYKGITKKMKVERNVICPQCKGMPSPISLKPETRMSRDALTSPPGKGSEKPGANFKCKDCEGKGIKVQILRRGNFIQQTQGRTFRVEGYLSYPRSRSPVLRVSDVQRHRRSDSCWRGLLQV